MSIVVCDLDAVGEAQSQLNALRQRLSDEANQHGSIQGQIEQRLRDIANDASQEMLHHHSLDPHHLWDRHGLGWLSQATYDRHRAVEDMQGRLRWIIQQVQAAHGTEIGGLIGLQASDIDPKLGQLLAALWDATTTLNPGNLLWLARESWEIGNRLNTAGHWFSMSRGELDGFLSYLDQLWHREDRVVRALLTGLGANSSTLLFGAGGAAALIAGEWLVSPQGKKTEAEIASYVRRHLNVEVTPLAFDKKHLGISSSLDANDGDYRLQGEKRLAGIPAHGSANLTVAHLAASAHAQLLSPQGPTVGAEASFVAASAGAHGLLGSKMFGLTGGAKVDVLEADASVEVSREGTTAEAGVSLVTGTVSAGVDIAGENVGVEAAAGLKWEWGFKMGKVVEVKLPLVSFGFTTGAAED